MTAEGPDGASETPRRSARQILVLAFPLAAAVGVFGISYGILARAAGFDPSAAIVASATTFAGSAQFASLSVLSSGGSTAAAIAAAILLNSRYLPIGISVASALPGRWFRRGLEGQLVVDESWAVATLGDGRFDVRTMIGTGILLYVAWIAGTTIGVFGATPVKDPATLGLDAAFPALFLALLVPQVRSRRALAAALLGGGVALVLIPFTPPGVPIVAASAACLVGLRRA